MRQVASFVVSLIHHLNEELDRLRKKFKVPASGQSINTGVNAIFGRIVRDGMKDAKWNAPGSQTARLQALEKAGASNWKGGFFLADNGDLKFPFIDNSGTAQISGIRAVISRSADFPKVQSTAQAVLEKINKRKKDK